MARQLHLMPDPADCILIAINAGYYATTDAIRTESELPVNSVIGSPLKSTVDSSSDEKLPQKRKNFRSKSVFNIAVGKSTIVDKSSP